VGALRAPTPPSNGDDLLFPRAPLCGDASVPTPLSLGDRVNTSSTPIERGHGGNEVSPAHLGILCRKFHHRLVNVC